MIVGIIQARMSSSRLPEKIMLSGCGKTFFEHMIERVRQCNTLDNIIVATTLNKKDSIIEDFCRKMNLDCFRGSEEDVLSRYKLAAESVGADIIVRLTADTPLIASSDIDIVVETYLKNNYDFVNNSYPLPRTYPDGYNVEVFSMNILREANDEAKKPSDREHVTFFMWMQPQRYRVYRLDYKRDLSNYRLNLDYPEDYIVLKSIFKELYPKNPFFTLEDIINWLDTHPTIRRVNSHIKTGEGFIKSFNEDRKAGF